MNQQLNSRTVFTLTVILIAIVSMTNCSTSDESINANRGGNQNLSATVAESASPTPSPSTSPSPVGSPTATPREQAQMKFGTAWSEKDDAWVIRGKKIPLDAGKFQLLNKDRVGVNDDGVALLNFEGCGIIRLFSLFGAGELRASPCSRDQVLSGTCIYKGGVNFSVGERACSKKITPGTNTVEVNLQPADTALYRSEQQSTAGLFSHSRFVQLRSIVRAGQKAHRTDVMVYYFPTQKISLVQVRDGEVNALPVLQEATRKIRRKLGEPVAIRKNEFLITEPGGLPGPNIVGVPQRVAVSAEKKIDPVLDWLKFNESPSSTPRGVPPVKPGKGTEIAIASGASTADSETRAIIEVLPNPLKFGEEIVGKPALRTVNVRKLGGLPIVMEKKPTISGSADFSVPDTDCTKNPIIRCEFDVLFTPTGVGERQAELVISYNDKDSPSRIPLIGVGTAPLLSPIELKLDASSESTSFPIQKVGATETRHVTVKNTGQATLKIDKILVGGDGKVAFLSKNNCSGAIAPNETCTVDVTFAPQAGEGFTANLTISATEVNSIATVPRTIAIPPIELKGAGGVPVIKIDQPSLCFEKHKVVKDSDPKVRQELSLTISNTGPVPLTVSKITVGEDDFKIVSESCTAADVAAKSGECRVTVGFTPRKSRLRQGTLKLIHDDTKDNPTSIALTGVGKHRNLFKRAYEAIFKRTKDPCK